MCTLIDPFVCVYIQNTRPRGEYSRHVVPRETVISNAIKIYFTRDNIYLYIYIVNVGGGVLYYIL